MAEEMSGVIYNLLAWKNKINSAAGRIRTCDHRLNRPTLYQLSYGGSLKC